MAVRKVKLCKEKGCNNTSTTDGYCRVHYLKNWREIKDKAKQRALKSLNKYIDHIMHKNPNGYIDDIREDLRDFDQFKSKAEAFNSDDDFHDVMEEISSDDVTKIIGNIKVDDSY